MDKPTYRLVPTFCFGKYHHCIGGKDWNYDPQNSYEKFSQPTHILTLDLRDPVFQKTFHCGQNELPIYAYTDPELIGEVQAYSVIGPQRKVVFERPTHKSNDLRTPKHQPFVFPITPCKIEILPQNQLCLDETSYWNACDHFLGCSENTPDLSVIRILGEPVWLEYVVTEMCECGQNMSHILSIGYDVSQNSPYIPGDMFMFGELALYYFFCSHCFKFHVFSQSS